MQDQSPDLLAAVKAWAHENYSRGADVLVEAFTDDELRAEIIASATTVADALTNAAGYCGLHEEQRANVLSQSGEHDRDAQAASARAAALTADVPAAVTRLAEALRESTGITWESACTHAERARDLYLTTGESPTAVAGMLDARTAKVRFDASPTAVSVDGPITGQPSAHGHSVTCIWCGYQSARSEHEWTDHEDARGWECANESACRVRASGDES